MATTSDHTTCSLEHTKERFYLHIHTVIPFLLQYQHYLGLSEQPQLRSIIIAYGMAFRVISISSSLGVRLGGFDTANGASLAFGWAGCSYYVYILAGNEMNDSID